MNHGLRNIRGAVGMGLLWAVAWAPVGVLIGAIVDPNESTDEPWLMVGLVPGFLCRFGNPRLHFLGIYLLGSRTKEAALVNANSMFEVAPNELKLLELSSQCLVLRLPQLVLKTQDLILRPPLALLKTQRLVLRLP